MPQEDDTQIDYCKGDRSAMPYIQCVDVGIYFCLVSPGVSLPAPGMFGRQRFNPAFFIGTPAFLCPFWNAIQCGPAWVRNMRVGTPGIE